MVSSVVSSTVEAAVVVVEDVEAGVTVGVEDDEAEAAVDVEVAAAEAADEAEALAHVVCVVGLVVKAVTVKAGVSPTAQTQHGSPKASPLVMDELGNVVLQKSAVQVALMPSKAVPNAV